MVKEPKNIDFTTTGRQLSDKEFSDISNWIKKRKKQLKSADKRRASKRKKA